MALEQIKTKEEIDLISFELKILKDEIKLLEKQEEYLQALSSNKKRVSKQLNDEETRAIEKSKQALIDSRKRSMQAKIKIEQAVYLGFEIGQMKLFGYIGCFIGVMLTFCGFLLWYRRLQKYQDQIIKREAQKQIKNNSEKK